MSPEVEKQSSECCKHGRTNCRRESSTCCRRCEERSAGTGLVVAGVQQIRTAGSKSSTARSGGSCKRRFSEQEGGAVIAGKKIAGLQVADRSVRMKKMTAAALGLGLCAVAIEEEGGGFKSRSFCYFQYFCT